MRNVNATSRYTPQWDSSKCTLCETCIETCQFDVIHRVDDDLSFNLQNCIGCGLCVSKCPDEAIEMTFRQELPNIPKNNTQLWNNIRNEAIVTLLKDKIVSFFSFSKK